MLSEVNTDYLVHLTIKDNYILQNIIQEMSVSSRINLSQKAHNLVITSHQANKYTPKEIKVKLLAPYNSVSQYKLKNLYSSQNSICDYLKLHQFIERNNLHI